MVKGQLFSALATIGINWRALKTTRALVSPFTNIAFNVCRCRPSSGFQTLSESNEQLRLGAFITGQQ
jgi:hypothetical protein